MTNMRYVGVKSAGLNFFFGFQDTLLLRYQKCTFKNDRNKAYKIKDLSIITTTNEDENDVVMGAPSQTSIIEVDHNDLGRILNLET